METKKVKIILIEDDEDDQLLFSLALNSILIPTELTVIKDARDIKSNILLFRNLLPDIIFFDLNLGAVNGLEYLEKIRKDELINNVPCIILTDSLFSLNIEKAYSMGANLYIVKPVNFSVLVDMIKNIYHLNWTDYFPPKREVFYINQR